MALVVRAGIIAAAAVLAAAAGCERRPAADLVFEPEARVLASGKGRDPSLHVAPSGAFALLFARATTDRGYDVVLAASPDGGDSFPDRRTIGGNADAHGESSPLYLVDARERRFAIWITDGRILVSRSPDYGRTFTDPLPVDATGRVAFFSAATAPDGTLLIAWLDYEPVEGSIPGTASLRLARSEDGGQTFGEAVRVASNVCPCCRPSLAARADGRWFVAWRSTDAENVRDVALARSEDRGRTWSKPVRVSDDGWKIDGCPHSGPSIAAEAGGLHVAWTTAADGEPRVFTSRSADGEAFSPRRELSTGLLDANHPRLAVVGERVLAAFQAREGDERAGFAPSRVWVADLASESPPVAAPPGRGSAVYPDLHALGASRVAVAWTDVTDEGVEVRLARARLGEGTR